MAVSGGWNVGWLQGPVCRAADRCRVLGREGQEEALGEEWRWWVKTSTGKREGCAFLGPGGDQPFLFSPH